MKGPASYFPSIERTYGQPIEHWMKLLRAGGDKKHMELVSMLKTDHGHANALVSHYLAQK